MRFAGVSVGDAFEAEGRGRALSRSRVASADVEACAESEGWESLEEIGDVLEHLAVLDGGGMLGELFECAGEGCRGRVGAPGQCASGCVSEMACQSGSERSKGREGAAQALLVAPVECMVG